MYVLLFIKWTNFGLIMDLNSQAIFAVLYPQIANPSTNNHWLYVPYMLAFEIKCAKYKWLEKHVYLGTLLQKCCSRVDRACFFNKVFYNFDCWFDMQIVFGVVLQNRFASWNIKDYITYDKSIQKGKARGFRTPKSKSGNARFGNNSRYHANRFSKGSK